MSTETARHNMVEQQIRPWDVLDDNVLNLIADVPREEYVPAGYQNIAFGDLSVPLDFDEAMMPPRLEARMLQALAIKSSDTVLEIGTGSGFVTTLLAKSARHVFSVDIQQEFITRVGAKLAEEGIINVTLEQGDAAQGWPQHGPYDVIAVTGSLPVLPDAFAQSLTVGGRMFVIVGDSPVMEAELITRLNETEFRTEMLFETDLPPLRNCLQPDRFVL
ncbi:Protein-L-isoaspartate O-methyltransferase [hydrothermal vent metagenome]|uniref:Protein-L-isoaspartate O-methyltransferase n=1 Tax=hydrothermal vent metagenome TaxID=652676 RepID=A0A3B1AAN0_9ZZZZ